MRVLTTGMSWITAVQGGLNRYVADFSRAWLHSGEDMRVVAADIGKIEAADVPSYVRLLHTRGRGPLAVWRSWKEVLQEEIQTESYDLINPHFAYYAYPLIHLPFECPMVMHFHGPWAYEGKVESQRKRPFWEVEIKFRFAKWIEKRIYQQADQFIVLSKSFQKQLAQKYGIPAERIHIIPGAVDVNRFCEADDQERVRHHLGLPKDRFVLVTVRRLVERMGLENLIAAVDKLRHDFPQIFLVMVGGGPLYTRLREAIERLSLHNWVQLTGRVSDEILPQYFQAADLAVIPSIALEGFGLATVEAMACGTPATGTPVGGTQEILQSFCSSLLLPGTTEEDLVVGLGNLLSHPERIPGRKETRFYVLEHYTWAAVIPQIRQVFEMAIGEKNRFKEKDEKLLRV